MRNRKNTLLHLFSAQASWIHPSFGRYTLTPAGDSPCARVGHSCLYLPPVGDAKRGKVFIVGGADPNRSFSDVHTMDLGKTSSSRACACSQRAGLLVLARTRAFLGTPVQNTQQGFPLRKWTLLRGPWGLSRAPNRYIMFWEKESVWSPGHPAVHLSTISPGDIDDSTSSSIHISN